MINDGIGSVQLFCKYEPNQLVRKSKFGKRQELIGSFLKIIAEPISPANDKYYSGVPSM